MTPTSQEHHMTTTDTDPNRWRKNTTVEIEAMQLAGTTSELHAVVRLWVEGRSACVHSMAAGGSSDVQAKIIGTPLTPWMRPGPVSDPWTPGWSKPEPVVGSR